MKTFRCAYVSKSNGDKPTLSIQDRPVSELPDGDTLIKVQWSSLNYKDALAAQGHPGVVRELPHVPGIDAAGTVVESAGSDLESGQEVIVTGHELGAAQWGGWAQLIRVPHEWVIPLPKTFSLAEAMMYGTAGFTAAQSVRELIRNEVLPDSGPVVVTGATGGVGCISVAILSKLGYSVTAVTGKESAATWLRDLGATRVANRDEVTNDAKKPLLSTVWAGAVDTVGGGILSNVIRSMKANGCVAACGMVAGNDLPVTVFPFILRGVRLAGITSSLCPRNERLKIWRKLSEDWRISDIAAICTDVPLGDVQESLRKILAGQLQGRVILAID